jgi:hypothetical protein
LDLLFFEVNKVLVVLKDSDVCKGAPCVLNFLGSDGLAGLLLDLLLALFVAAPGPLNLNGCDMVHRKSVVFEKSAR